MIQDGPWNRYRQTPPAGAPAPVAVPERIIGAPKQPDPIELRRLDLSEQANVRAAHADDRSAEANARANAAAERQATAAERTANNLNETQSKATGFYISARGAEAEWKSLEADPELKRGTQPVGMLGDAARAILPANVVNSNTSGARQRAQQAKENFIRASLRLESGAAIGKEEFERQDRIFYPQTGDTPEQLEQKARARQQIIDGFRIQAGPGAERAEALPEPRTTPMDKEQYAAQLGKMMLEGKSKEDILAFARDSGYKIDDPSAIDALRGSKVKIKVNDYQGEDYGKDFMRGVGGVVQGVGDVLGLIANPVNAGINAVAGTNLSTDIGASMRSGLGLPFPESDQERAIDAVNRGGTAGLVTLGAAGAAAGPMAFAGGGGGGGGAVTNALARVAAAPVTDTVSGGTSALSSELARQNGAGPVGQIGAGVLGGGLTAGGMAAGRSLTQPRPVNALMAAANRQGVEPLAADVGGATTRRLTAGAVQGPLSAAPIVGKAARSQTQMRDAAGRVASAVGRTLPIDEAGAAVRLAGQRFSRQSSQRGGKLYDRARQMAGDVKLASPKALAEIDAQIARLSEAKEVNAPLIAELEKFRASLGKGAGLSVSGLRDVRSIAGKAAYTEALRSTPAKQVLGRVVDAIADDIDTGLTTSGKGNAARAFRVADRFWKERVEEIDQVLEPVIGKGKSGEDVLQAFESMAAGKKGGVDRLSRMIRMLPEQEAGDVQATIIDRIGKAAPGQQNAENTAFSAATFLSNWNRMSDKSKAILFPTPEARRNLSDIAALADGMKQSQKFANHSNTSGGNMAQFMLTGGLGAFGGLKGLAVATIAQYGSGKLLASRALTNWVARAPTSPSPRYIDRLAAIAVKEPAIANEVRQMQQRLTEAMGQLPQRAAASGPNANEDVARRREEVPRR